VGSVGFECHQTAVVGLAAAGPAEDQISHDAPLSNMCAITLL
jgi:hypothetical protein